MLLIHWNQIQLLLCKNLPHNFIFISSPTLNFIFFMLPFYAFNKLKILQLISIFALNLYKNRIKSAHKVATEQKIKQQKNSKCTTSEGKVKRNRARKE